LPGEALKPRYIVILGALDTKGEEVAFLRGVVQAEGGVPLVVDTGVLGTPTIPADVPRERVAEAAGTSLAAVVAAGDKSQALVIMADGAAYLVGRLLSTDKLGGVLSIGGSRGTALGTRVMQSLPVGVPKLMVSTMASGSTPFGPYVGTKDVTMMPSVADILGVNAVTRPILTNAAAAIVAMSRVGRPVTTTAEAACPVRRHRVLRKEGGLQVRRQEEPGSLAATMLGATTTLVEQIRSMMKTATAGNAGEALEVIAFHAVGSGGRSMEELIAAGLFRGVFDVTVAEMAAWLAGGPHSAGPDRMRAAGRLGIPQVVAPGGLDFIIEGPPESLPARYAGRKTMRHTPTITLVRTSANELDHVGQLIAERMEESCGPLAAILPLQGFSWFSLEGQPLHDAEADRAFLQAFRSHVPARAELVEMDTHINDSAVAETAVAMMRAMLHTC